MLARVPLVTGLVIPLNAAIRPCVCVTVLLVRLARSVIMKMIVVYYCVALDRLELSSSKHLNSGISSRCSTARVPGRPYNCDGSGGLVTGLGSFYMCPRLSTK